jgi:methanethiol S-methyltransferase
MNKRLILLYGIIAYAIGMGGLMYFILFVGGWSFMPIHVNSGIPGPLPAALLVNVVLILVFGMQHSLMARADFKKRLTAIFPAVMERSTYVLLSGILMLVISLNWQAIEGTVWLVQNSLGRSLLISLHVAGWAIAVIATFLINHFELFGLQQVWCNFKNRAEPPVVFSEKWFYKLVRHPLQFGILMGLWITPYMSATLFFLAVAMTVYIFIGLHFEEKDLIAQHGEGYRDYQRRVRKIIPLPK